jgi:hypothetical protein
MEAGTEVRGAEVGAGQAVETETAPAPQGAVPAAPAGGEWMEIPAAEVLATLSRMWEGESLELEVNHFGTVSRLLIVAANATLRDRYAKVFVVFEWRERERELKRRFPVVFKRKRGRKLERGVWTLGGAWSEDLLPRFVEWLAGKRGWERTPWSELKIKTRRYALSVRP